MKVSITIPFFLLVLMTITVMAPLTLRVAEGKSGVSLDPTADAGDDIKTPENKIVRLDGSGSSPGFGRTIESFTWTIIYSGKNDPRISLFNEDTIQPSFRAPEVTEVTRYTFKLVVTDNLNHSDSDTVSVHVLDMNAVTTTLDQEADFMLSCPPFCLGDVRDLAHNLNSTADPFALIFPGIVNSTTTDNGLGAEAKGTGGNNVDNGGGGGGDNGDGAKAKGDHDNGDGAKAKAKGTGDDNGVFITGDSIEGVDGTISKPYFEEKTSNMTAVFVFPNGTVSYITGLHMNETHIADVKNELIINYTHRIQNITKATASVTDSTSNATVIFIPVNGNVSYVTQLSLNSTDLVFLKDLLTRDYLYATGNTTMSANRSDE